MRFFYDEEGDVLDISILNFEKRAEVEKGFKIPVEARFHTV